VTQILVAGANTFQECSTLLNRNLKDLRENDHFSVWVALHGIVAPANPSPESNKIFILNILRINRVPKKFKFLLFAVFSLTSTKVHWFAVGEVGLHLQQRDFLAERPSGSAKILIDAEAS
jgi:hypothetical protein